MLFRSAWLLDHALTLQLTGVKLKDESDAVLPLDRREAVIHEEVGAGDEARLVAREE